MDQDQDIPVSLVNLLTLPIELLVYIISFLLLRDRIKLKYVSRCLRSVLEETPLLWKKFVWPYYDSREEHSVKEMLKVCGLYIKVLSFPNSRVPPTLVEMLQCCSNIKHLSLPSTNLDPEQLRTTINHLRYLQTLELKVDDDNGIKQLFLNSGQLRELNLITGHPPKDVLDYYMQSKLRPPRVSVFSTIKYSYYFTRLVNYAYAAHLSTTIPTGTTANFRVYSRHNKIPVIFSPTLPYFQLQVDESGQVTVPHVKFSKFGILGLNKDLGLMTDCQYGGKVAYQVRCQVYNDIVNKLNSIRSTRCDNLSCVTHFDLVCSPLHSGHLEQLAIACPNLQRLDVQYCSRCLTSLKGLQAIASHCNNLQGLNLLGIHVSKVENQIQLWETLSDMKLTHLAVDFHILKPKASNKEKLICLYQKFWTLRGIQCSYCWYFNLTDEDTLILSYFPSLQYCYASCDYSPPTFFQDVLNSCKGLRCASYFNNYYTSLSLSKTHNHNLQQLFIHSSHTDVPDDFMTSVSAHGGLVHVVMMIRSLTLDGIISLVRNSPKLITLYFCICNDVTEGTGTLEKFNATLKDIFWNRKLFTAGYCKVDERNDDVLRDVLYEQGTDLFPLW